MLRARKKTIKVSLLVAVILLAMTFLLSTPASAHRPKSVDLKYEPGTQTLSVTIIHSVKNPAKHYIEKISISVNGEKVSEHEYKNQPDKKSFTVEYNVAAKDGDTIKVKASCSYIGSKSTKLIPGK
ncbi:MAG: hypothetical protein HQ589_06135 [Syntrophaceae bacterium]|nr:hypothetical protein [Syntrophaceae bacterium]